VEDNVIAVLARLGNEREPVRRILRGIAGRGKPGRSTALQELTLLAGLRGLVPLVKEEMTQMPITEDIMDHPFFGPKIRDTLNKGQAIGQKEGRKEGLGEGLERERQLVLRQIGKRFGTAPVSTRKRIEALPVPKLERIALRLFDVQSFDELLG